MDFTAFEKTKPLPNTVYAIHDYSKFGFPGSEQYTGTDAQKFQLRASLDRKCQFMREVGVPVSNGEFGPVYQDPRVAGAEAAEVTNASRIKLLEYQLSMYREAGISWSIWLYKDIGYQAMTYIDPESPYMRLIRPFLEMKQRLGLDFWTVVSRDSVKPVYEPFLAAIRDMVDPRFRSGRYPYQWTIERQFERVIREALLSEYVGLELAELFLGKSETQLEELAASFALKNCRVRYELNDVLRRDAILVSKP